jgi:2-polyprenyl-3-methyl-5-hydroxy-6-metoxy-1,4-benzoquinol methylase
VDYKNLIYYYNLADVFILPSVRDEDGNLDDQSVSVVEAMACSKPIVTTDFSGYKFVVAEGENGYLTHEKDSKKISVVLIKLLKDRILRNKMGKESRKRVLDFFSWDVIGKEYSQLFERLTTKYYSQGVPKILDEKERARVAKQIWGVVSSKITSPKRLNCLDVGSSSGVISNFLAGQFKNVTAVDIDENAIKIAKNKFKKKNLRFMITNIEELEFKSDSFDIIICNQVYNFVENPKKLMSEIHRVLKPNGTCFFGARNKFAIIEPQYNLPFGSWFPSILPFGKKYLSYSELRKLLEKFDIDDYTIKILKNPRKYGFKKLEKYSLLTKYFPLKLFYNLIPNYIWMLEKKQFNP